MRLEGPLSLPVPGLLREALSVGADAPGYPYALEAPLPEVEAPVPDLQEALPLAEELPLLVALTKGGGLPDASPE